MPEEDEIPNPPWYPEEGDVCPHCQTTVKTQWSGISCDCGRTWFCY